MTVDVLFLAHNRLAFTKASFQALIDNTNWAQVGALHVIDDRSYDGTAKHLEHACADTPVPALYQSRRIGNPVWGMNLCLDATKADVIAKIDNDLIVCPGWLERLTEVLESAPDLDVLGMEPGFGEPVVAADQPRTWRPAPHVGGIGLIRTRIFTRDRPEPSRRFFGWTRFQERYAQCGWVTPDLPCFLLDHLPVEPWRTLTDRYVEQGWSRRWTPYSPNMHPYWDWYLEPAKVTA